MIYEINPKKHSDIQLLHSFAEEYHGPFFRYFQKRLPEQAVLTHVLTILDIDNGKIRGYAHIDYDTKSSRKFMGICVLEKYQKQGIGTILLKYILEFADNNDIILYLSVDKENLVARKMYEKLDFYVIEEKELFDFYVRSPKASK